MLYLKKVSLTVICVFVFLFMPAIAFSSESAPGASSPESSAGLPNLKYYKGKVLTVETITALQDQSLGQDEVKQISQIQFIQGPFTGRVYTGIVSYIREKDPQQIYLEVDDIVIVSAELTNEGDNVKSMYVYSYYRAGKLIFLLLAMAVFVSAFCWMSGVRSIIAILFFSASMLFVFVPLSLRGISPVILSLPIALVVGAILIFSELGMSARGFSAFLAFAVSNAFAAFLGLLFEKSARLTGLGESELSMLLYMRDHSAINYNGMVFATVMLASISSICTVTMHAVTEIHNYELLNPYVSKKELFFKGLNLSQPQAARSAVSLFTILVSSIAPIWILYASYGTSLMQLTNTEVIAIQFFRAACAVSGVLICLPLSCLFYVFGSNRNEY